MEEGTYGCFAGRFAFGMPASIGGAFAVLCDCVGLVIEDVVAGWGGLVLSACCFKNFSLAPEPPGVLVGIFMIHLCGGFELGRDLGLERCRGVRGVDFFVGAGSGCDVNKRRHD